MSIVLLPISILKSVSMKHIENVAAFRFASNSTENLTDRQKEIMGRSLPKKKAIDGVKHVIIVASGKGGVGKSTVAVNLAVSMKMLQPEKEIGLLDADVFGPSVPLMMDLHETPLLNEDNSMKPLVNYGVKCMSMGNLVTERSAVMWRGLMVMSAINKLLREVAWSPLDCLVIDTPPGTGDTHLSLIQNIPISGTVIVSTSQQAALQVAKRGIVMFQKLHIPIIGIVNNMSSVICPKCSTKSLLFSDDIQKFANENSVEYLQEIPVCKEITEGCDIGKPAVLTAKKLPHGEAFLQLGEKVIKFLESNKAIQ